MNFKNTCNEVCAICYTQAAYKILYTGKYLTPFYFRPFRLSCQWVNLRLSEFKLPMLPPLVQLCLGAFRMGRKHLKV